MASPLTSPPPQGPTHSRSTSVQTQFPSDNPATAVFADGNFVIGGGVAIFHLASSRVVLCFHGRDKYWFLPKGRRDVNETTPQGSEREGFEESGYRNRVLPLPIRHRQPQPRIPLDPRFSSYSHEPVFTQLYPQTATSQYICFWYISETVPPDVETALNTAEEEAEGDSPFGAPYQYPPQFPTEMRLKDRISLDTRVGYEPVRHENSGADEEEALYESYLVSVPEALEHLKGQPVMQYVVKLGWEGIQKRLAMEG